MRQTPNPKVEPYRVKRGPMASDERFGNNGAFMIPGPDHGKVLAVRVSDGGGWEHVSVSTKSRVPTWEEMCFIKDLFFEDEELVIQFHPPKSRYVNVHPHVLHLWKPIGRPLPFPPLGMV